MATKIFVDRDVNINQRFGAIATSNYDTELENLDFINSRDSAKQINDWVGETTKGHITNLVNEEAVANSVILMVNALYFSGAWRTPFNNSLTSDFFVAPNRKVTKMFIEQTGNFYYFNSKHLNAKILRLPYSGRRFSMFVVLPNDDNNLDSMIGERC